MLYEVGVNENIVIETTNTCTGEELKKMFRKKTKAALRDFVFRMFFAGNEIKNDHQLSQHKIEDGYKIMVMKVARERKTTKKNKNKRKESQSETQHKDDDLNENKEEKNNEIVNDDEEAEEEQN